jgi:ABC-type glycerol-3-phosphate transport system substrate-binding protein
MSDTITAPVAAPAPELSQDEITFRELLDGATDDDMEALMALDPRSNQSPNTTTNTQVEESNSDSEAKETTPQLLLVSGDTPALMTFDDVFKAAPADASSLERLSPIAETTPTVTEIKVGETALASLDTSGFRVTQLPKAGGSRQHYWDGHKGTRSASQLTGTPRIEAGYSKPTH